MEELCPRCHQHQVSKTNSGIVGTIASYQFGLVGRLISNATTSYSCPDCGKIPLSEFTDEFRSSVKKKRMLAITGVVGVLLLVVVLMAITNMIY